MFSSSPQVTLRRILEEVSVSSYAVRRSIHLEQLQKIWTAASVFVRSSLLRRRGVLIPSLGTFHALTSTKAARIEPVFELLDCRFFGVSQEVSHFDRRSKKSAVVNVNYQQLSRETSLHRACCQGTLKSIAERLAAHILAGHAVHVSFPSVGVLVRNKAGRIHFRFDKEFVQEMYQAPRRPKTSATAPQSTRVPSPQRSPQKLQRSPEKLCCFSEKGEDLSSVVEEGVVEMQTCNELDIMWKLCKGADASRSGLVAKTKIESWLQKECRRLLQRLDALTLLDLLQTHTSDKSGTALYYAQFLASLKEASYHNNTDCQVLQVHREEDANDDADAEEIVPGEADDASDGEGVEEDAPQTPYLEQSRRRQLSRRECDAFNAEHLRRLSTARVNGLAAKVGEEPHSPQRTPSPLFRAQTAPDPRTPSAYAKNGEEEICALHTSPLAKESSGQRLDAAWRHQMEEKARVLEEFRSAEEKWPYCPTHRPHVRVPVTAPRYVHAHYVRPYDAPVHPPHIHLTEGCSYWSGL